jgi:hypothetical protein
MQYFEAAAYNATDGVSAASFAQTAKASHAENADQKSYILVLYQ